MSEMRFVFIGLSITSSWGNGHATTYRGLVRELSRRGHDVLFLERDVPWYRENRDAPAPNGCRVGLYTGLAELRREFGEQVRDADVVVVGSYVPDGASIGRWVIEQARGLTAFYDIDTPITLAKLEQGDHEYLTPELVSCYGMYLSFTGGPTLDRLEDYWGAVAARHLPCSVDAERYRPVETELRWELGYLGTYSDDRQPSVERYLSQVARRFPERQFVVGGSSYPMSIGWPSNVARLDHVAPPEHSAFYAAQRWTLNVTRQHMVSAGWSPSVRLFEAAACGVPIVSDRWDGIERYFEPGREILLVDSTDDVDWVLRSIEESERRAIAERARARVLREHTAAVRAEQLERFVEELTAPRFGAIR